MEAVRKLALMAEVRGFSELMPGLGIALAILFGFSFKKYNDVERDVNDTRRLRLPAHPLLLLPLLGGLGLIVVCSQPGVADADIGAS